MDPYLMLALLGAWHAATYLMRMRSATGTCPTRSTVWTVIVGATWIAGMYVGVGAVMEGVPWWEAMICYVVSAGVVNLLLHDWLEARKKARAAWVQPGDRRSHGSGRRGSR